MTKKKRTVNKSDGLPDDSDGAAEELRERHWSEELGIHRTLLYKWRHQMEAVESKDVPLANSRERAMRAEIRELKRVLADRTFETDSFKGALRKTRLDAGAKESLKRGARRSRVS